MPASKHRKDRRKYSPNRTLNRCISIAERAVAAMPMRADAARDIEIAAHIALDRLISGADKDSLYVLASALDVSRELAARGVGFEHMADIERGMTALVRAKKHGDHTGVWVLTGAAARAASGALSIHDAQIEVASRAAVIDAIKTVTARVEGGARETEFEVMILEAA
ncbi:hypothetical protein WCQ02_31180 [Paraburkholderia tropica]|uniref:hypothetical protein n=1 Tax=Paraburkholderia tropica TaxID=92647 RepID=UPI003016865F